MKNWSKTYPPVLLASMIAAAVTLASACSNDRVPDEAAEYREVVVCVDPAASQEQRFRASEIFDAKAIPNREGTPLQADIDSVAVGSDGNSLVVTFRRAKSENEYLTWRAGILAASPIVVTVTTKIELCPH